MIDAQEFFMERYKDSRLQKSTAPLPHDQPFKTSQSKWLQSMIGEVKIDSSLVEVDTIDGITTRQAPFKVGSEGCGNVRKSKRK